MPQGRFNEYSPQEQAAAAAALLRQSGAPATAENMNRAYMALMQGGGMQGDNASVMERAMQRAMAPRRAAAPAPAAAPMPVEPRDDSGGNDGPDGTPPRPVQETAPLTRGEQVARASALPPEQRTAAMPGGRRGGSVNGATRFEETDEGAADMFRGQPPRQADETGVDQIGLALSLMLPLLGAAGAAGLGGRAAVGGAARTAAPRGAAPQAGSAVGRPAQPTAEYVGRTQMPPTGRVIDVPPTVIAGPAQRGALGGPGAPPPAIGGPGAGAPRLPGGGGGGSPRVGGPTVNQPRLPQADGDLRRRMIDRNMERSNRNAQRTRDERAAGNTTRGRRERIDPVPPGEATPRPPQQAIPLGRPRYRVRARSE